MKDELNELIATARRELRRASGKPLTPEKHAEDQRIAETEAMETFLFKTFGVRASLALKMEAEWTENGAVGRLSAGDQAFELRKTNSEYRLLLMCGQSEQELIRLTAKDPQFVNRVLVAIGESLDSAPSK